MKENLVEKAYEEIKNMIYKFQLPPGAKVSDFALSNQIGISRTPIRQAIMMLVSDGIVEASGSRFIVPAISIDRINAVYDARLAIEIGLLRLAIRNGIAEEDLKTLREKIDIVSKDYEASNVLEGIGHEIEMRYFLASLGNNTILYEAFKRVEKQSRVFSLFAVAFPIFLAPASYLNICNAIEAGNEIEAAMILEEFIEISRKQKINAIENFGENAFVKAYSHMSAVSGKAAENTLE